jgi:hypothetical protein
LFVDAWQAIGKIRTAGRARAIGVSKFLANHLETLLAAANVIPAEIPLGSDEMEAVTALERGARVGAGPAEAAFAQM